MMQFSCAIFLFLATTHAAVEAYNNLECYECADISVEGNGLASLLQGKSYPACASGMGASTTTCSSDQQCGLVKGTIETDSAILGDSKTTIRIRTCVPDTGAIRGCTGDLPPALKTLLGIAGIAAEVNVKLCVCSFDYCNPDSCDDGSVNVFDIACLPIWAVAVIGIVAFGILCSCFACCYCCCCKSKGNRGVVIQHAPTQPGMTVLHVGQASQAPVPLQDQAYGFTNKGYGMVPPSGDLQKNQVA